MKTVATLGKPSTRADITKTEAKIDSIREEIADNYANLDKLLQKRREIFRQLEGQLLSNREICLSEAGWPYHDYNIVISVDDWDILRHCRNSIYRPLIALHRCNTPIKKNTKRKLQVSKCARCDTKIPKKVKTTMELFMDAELPE